MTYNKKRRMLCAALSGMVVWWGASAPANAVDTALFTHCVSNWSAEAVGEVFCAWATEQGYPAAAPEGERSCVRAYQLGVDYFRWLDPQRNGSTTVECTIFVQKGPSLLPRW